MFGYREAAVQWFATPLTATSAKRHELIEVKEVGESIALPHREGQPISEREMKAAAKKRKAASSIKINPNVRCLRIYPVENARRTPKSIADLKTVGIKLSREQAIHLARVLLAAAQEWDEIDITAWRIYKRQSDGTYNVTVTTAISQ